MRAGRLCTRASARTLIHIVWPFHNVLSISPSHHSIFFTSPSFHSCHFILPFHCAVAMVVHSFTRVPKKNPGLDFLVEGRVAALKAVVRKEHAPTQSTIARHAFTFQLHFQPCCSNVHAHGPGSITAAALRSHFCICSCRRTYNFEDELSPVQSKQMQTYLTELITGGPQKESPTARALYASGTLKQYEVELTIMGFLQKKLMSADSSRRRQTSSTLPGYSESAIRTMGYKLGSLGCSKAMMRFFSMNPRNIKTYDLQHPSLPFFFGSLGTSGMIIMEISCPRVIIQLHLPSYRAPPHKDNQRDQIKPSMHELFATMIFIYIYIYIINIIDIKTQTLAFTSYLLFGFHCQSMALSHMHSFFIPAQFLQSCF